MRAVFNEKTCGFELALDENDIHAGLEVKKTMQSEGWKVLEEIWNSTREQLIVSIKDIPKTDAEMKKTALRGCVLRGFDEMLSVPKDIVKETEEFLNKQEETRKENEGNEPQNDDE